MQRRAFLKKAGLGAVAGTAAVAAPAIAETGADPGRRSASTSASVTTGALDISAAARPDSGERAGAPPGGSRS